MAHVLFFAALLVAALIFALLEVEIEGSEGWAAGLPTWRLENRWTHAFLGGRPLTGYHVGIHLFLLVVMHLPYAILLVRPTWSHELKILSFIALFWLVEDFLWFILNPAYGLARFRKHDVGWHARSWWIFMPREYWIFLPVGLALYVASWMV